MLQHIHLCKSRQGPAHLQHRETRCLLTILDTQRWLAVKLDLLSNVMTSRWM